MSRKRKELPTLESFELTDIAAEGNALGRTESGMVVFVPFGAPGDIADIKIDKKKKSFAIGHISRMIKPSDMRVTPRCQHLGICGGCRWQHIPYERQLQCKQQQVADALERIAKVDIPGINPILGSPEIWEYRNKMEYTFSNRSWLTFEQLASGEDFSDRDAVGFHIPGAFDKVLDIHTCVLQNDITNRLRNHVRAFAKSRSLSFYDLRAQHGLLRTMMIRVVTTGDIMVVMVFGEDNAAQIKLVMDNLAETFPEISSLQYVVNTKANDTFGDLEVYPYRGTPYIEEEMEGLRFRIGPKSFYQTNSRGAYQLYRVVRNFASLEGDELVYDLYTGTGTIANFVSRYCRHVVGIEYVPEAIEDAKVNANVNSIDNTEFYAGDMKDVLNDQFVKEHGHPDVIIVDPPRAGMHQDVVDVLLRTAAMRIVYVSCNPATQARDLALLDPLYRVTSVQPVDMFPHTQHVENVVCLNLRDVPKQPQKADQAGEDTSGGIKPVPESEEL